MGDAHCATHGADFQLPKPTRGFPLADQQYKLGDVSKVTGRGFLAEFTTFIEKRDVVDLDALTKEFVGRSIGGKKITAARVKHYLSYCRVHGIVKKT